MFNREKFKEVFECTDEEYEAFLRAAAFERDESQEEELKEVFGWDDDEVETFFEALPNNEEGDN